jgi:hypothetical protein
LNILKTFSGISDALSGMWVSDIAPINILSPLIYVRCLIKVELGFIACTILNIYIYVNLLYLVGENLLYY